MPMFTRKGTIVRKARGSGRRQSTRRPQASANGTYASAGPLKNVIGSKSPLSKSVTTPEDAKPSPAKSIASTSVSFDDKKRLVTTKIDWSSIQTTGTDDYQSDYSSSCLVQVQEASKETNSTCDFVGRAYRIVCSTVLVSVLVGILIALPISMMSVGVKYLDDCPKEPRIPVYLLVGGCFGAIKLLASLWRNIQYRRFEHMDYFDNSDSDGVHSSRTFQTFDVLLLAFIIAWQIFGTYLIFRIWTPHYIQLLHEPNNWCDRTVYLFALYQNIICYGLFCIVILVLCCLTACFRCSRMF